MQARLIDVREYPEFTDGHIEGSELIPLGTLDKASDSSGCGLGLRRGKRYLHDGRRTWSHAVERSGSVSLAAAW